MAILEGKKAIIIGDRDGIPGPAIAECVKLQVLRSYSHLRNVSSERAQAQWIWKTRRE